MLKSDNTQEKTLSGYIIDILLMFGCSFLFGASTKILYYWNPFGFPETGLITGLAFCVFAVSYAVYMYDDMPIKEEKKKRDDLLTSAMIISAGVFVGRIFLNVVCNVCWLICEHKLYLIFTD